jgi:ADP-heptose:LPS heptosyltransferase
MLYPANSILVIDVSPFGRSLELLPALEAIREAYPNAFIAVAASTGICELVVNGGLVSESIDLGVIKADDTAGFKRAVRLIKDARRFNLDLVVDFAPKPETQFLSRFVLRARTITSARLPQVIEFLTRARRPGGERQAEYENVLRKLGLEVGGRLTYKPTSEENAKFEELLSRRGFKGGEPVVVLYTAGGVGSWGFESFGEIAQRLTNNFNARVVAADEPGDENFTTALAALLPKTAIRLVQPRAVDLMAALARASLVITDEPNIATVAMRMGTPVIDVAAPSTTAPSRASVPSRAATTTDEVYEEAAEILQESRSSTLFRQ